MKEVIISFIIYVIYDAYMRKRDEDKYVSRQELVSIQDQLYLKKTEYNKLVDLLRADFDKQNFSTPSFSNEIF